MKIRLFLIILLTIASYANIVVENPYPNDYENPYDSNEFWDDSINNDDNLESPYDDTNPLELELIESKEMDKSDSSRDFFSTILHIAAEIVIENVSYHVEDHNLEEKYKNDKKELADRYGREVPKIINPINQDIRLEETSSNREVNTQTKLEQREFIKQK